ncbi:hypothetical protein VTJ83DRAFT_5987 [Remersonia thermophila]|uniref:BZIP domain-containing protein n=1 Tax=Remersonia thermophila TaxID=72144 RepID=A0ABR4D8D9_9PEZI
MASLSPNPPPQPAQPGFSTGLSTVSKSPLSTLNLDFLRAVTEKRTTRDGRPQKRRGPKPDSKPALTRRQELNRQAQRTHRERKELYIKALEDEVLRLKELFSNICHERERLAEENQQLRTLLAQNGIPVAGSSVLDDAISNPSAASAAGGYSPSSMAASSSSYRGGPASSNTTALTPPPLSASSHSQGRGGGISPHSATYPPLPQGQLEFYSSPGQQQQQQQQQQGGGGVGVGGANGGSPPPQNPNPALDYEQAGIDFVLTLEKPCMNHLPWMLERGAATGIREPCGHALMASCPPEPFSELSPDIPFGQVQTTASAATHGHGHGHGHGQQQGQQGQQGQPGQQQGPEPGNATWTLSKGDLATLLDLSRRLDLDGEITPVMAWGMVLAHPRLGELREEDFVRLAEELKGKVRCYGFGAVMEEFEVRDALENIFSMKQEFGMAY